jgi:hypothetical protein
MPRIQNHFGHIWYDVLLFIFVIWNLFLNLILYQTLGPKLISHFVGMHVGMGPEYNRGDPNHHWSIKRGCLAQFLIRWLYTRLEVAKIIFYHQPHMQINGEPTHGKHNLHSIVQPICFVPRMSQAFKDHIWTQLGLSYTVKQIYDKHKAILWARINVGEAMTRDAFIRQQDIVYLDCKHKKRS